MKISNETLVKILCILIALLVVLAFAACSYLDSAADNLALPMDKAEETKTDIPVKKDEKYNFILAGTDSGGGRTDVIMLANVNVAKKRISIVSIPRDTYVISSGTSRKINACNAVGGAKLLVKTVEETFGVQVDGYAIVDLEVFSKVVNALGGVEVTLSEDMKYSDPAQGLYIDLKAGTQVLNGKQAECFVRYRSGYAFADLTRIEAQKIFIAALADKLLSAEGVSRLPAVISTVFEELNTNIPTGKMLSIALKLIGIKLDDIVVYTLPGEAYNHNKVSYYTLYKDETLALMDMRFNTSGSKIMLHDTTMTELGRIVNNKFDYNGTPLSTLIGKASPNG